MDIVKLETGLWTATHNGERVGSIYTNDGDGAIAQHTGCRSYTAVFRPNPTAQGFNTTGTLKHCKKFLMDWSLLFEC